MLKTINNENGVALVLAIFVMVLMTLLGTAALYLSTLNVTISGNEKTGLQAYYAALAGIRDAEQRLINNTADTRGGYVSTATPCPTPNTTTKCDPNWSSAISSGANALATGATYSVRISHVRDSVGTSVPLDANNYPTYRITSTGTYGDSQRIVEKAINLTFSSLWTRSVTACGAFSVDSNSGTDSYSSTGGAYGGANVSNVGDVYASGDVSLNANTSMKGKIQTTGSISADSNVQIGISGSPNNLQAKGNISFGTNNTLYGNASAGGTVSGTCSINCTSTSNDSTALALTAPPQCNSSNFLPIKASSGNNDNSAANVTCSGSCSAACRQSSPTTPCSVNSGNMTLAGSADPANPRRYYFNGLNINSNANIKTTGYVEIYVNGDYHQDANTIVCGSGCNTSSRTAAQTSNPKPAEILVYVNGAATGTVCSTGQAACAKIDSKSDLYGKLYAPTSGSTNINSNAHVYGAVIAANICSNCNSGGIDSNAGVSFDSALSSAASQTAGGSVVSNLRECNYGTSASGSGAYAAGSCNPK